MTTKLLSALASFTLLAACAIVVATRAPAAAPTDPEVTVPVTAPNRGWAPSLVMSNGITLLRPEELGWFKTKQTCEDWTKSLGQHELAAVEMLFIAQQDDPSITRLRTECVERERRDAI